MNITIQKGRIYEYNVILPFLDKLIGNLVYQIPLLPFPQMSCAPS